MPPSITIQRSARPGSIWPAASKRTRPCAVESISRRLGVSIGWRRGSTRRGGAPIALTMTGPVSGRR
ncbi:hypothetical protein QP162_14255 [Sphingomonas aurantiaca]|uniref:hypothetical protein n=1 Tax=Sphingomonas aurantiaca TaxID=185949 RepID=UPI002FE1B2BE